MLFAKLLVSICLLAGQNAQAQSTNNPPSVPVSIAPANESSPTTELFTNTSSPSISTTTTSVATTPLNVATLFTTETMSPERPSATSNPTIESSTGDRFRLIFSLESPFEEALYNTSSAEFLLLANQVQSTLNVLFDSSFGSDYIMATINGFSPGSIVVDTELNFKTDSGMSASVVAETLTVAASGDGFSLPLNVSSIVVSALSLPTSSSFLVRPIITYISAKGSSLEMLTESTLTSYITEFLQEALGSSVQLSIKVKQLVQCTEDNC